MGLASSKPIARPAAARTAAATRRTARKSAGTGFPGRPASSSRFSRSWRAFCGVERESIDPSFSIAGRITRSLKGPFSSTSASVSGFSPPYTERRCWTICAVLVLGVRARPMKMISTPSPQNSESNRTVLISNLDRDHAPDDHVADKDHEGPEHDQSPADDAFEHRPEVARGDEVHEGGEDDGQERNQGSRGSGLCGQGRNLSLETDPFPDRIGNVVEDLGQVATHCAVDRIGRGHEVEVGA